MSSPALVPLACSNCGAALTATPEGNLIRCEYCKAAHMFLAPPPPRTASTKSNHSAGEAVMVEWGGRWWKAHVVDAHGDGRWKIHYDGWGDRWDETVGEDRIHPAGSEKAAPSGGRAYALVVLAIIVGTAVIGVWSSIRSGSSSSHPSRSEPTGDTITAQTVIRVAEHVEVLDAGAWYDAHVLALRSDGRIRVHYDGWASTYDEDVPRERVRVFGAHTVAASAAVPLATVDAATGSSETAVPGSTIEPNATLRGGDPVWAFSERQWWRAEIVRRLEDGRYEVRYIGYEQRWNESLAIDQLRRRTE